MEDLAVCARDYAALSPVIFGVCFAVIPVFMVLLNPNLKQLAIFHRLVDRSGCDLSGGRHIRNGLYITLLEQK